MYKLNKPLIALLVPVMLACLPGPVVAQEKPNIVLVFLDNFGWGSRDSMAAELFAAPLRRGSTSWPPRVSG